MVAISARGLSKSYRLGAAAKHDTLRDALTQGARRLLGRGSSSGPKEEFWALRNVSFDVEQGEVMGIIGRNGAGKSTLLKLLSRITMPSEGEARIRGRVASLLEVGTGFHSELTGRENIFLNGAIMGMSRAEITRKFDEIVAFAEVERFLDTPVKRYSSGMYVRLAFAVAAHLEPEILVVDEVLAVGDINFQAKCLNKMSEINTTGRTVLFVSHNLSAVNRLCTKCILLEQGVLSAQGPVQEILDKYMAGGGHGETVFVNPANPKKDMNLRRVELNPGGAETASSVRYDKPIVIRVEFEVNRKVSNCSVWIALQTPEGVHAFATSDYDMDHSCLGERAEGYYKYDVHIPEKWLNVGRYTVIAGLVRNSPVEVFNREETISFNVLEVGTPGSILQPGVRRGILQPFLPWTKVADNG